MRRPDGPVVIADRSDNAGAGAASDSTYILAELIERDIRNATVGMMWDPMVVLFTVDEGHSVVDLFTPANIAQFQIVEQEMNTSDAIQSVVSPLTVLEWTEDLITKGVGSEIVARTIQREPDPDKAAIRQADATITTLRLGAAGKQDMFAAVTSDRLTASMS